jgi:hypothetical protein
MEYVTAAERECQDFWREVVFAQTLEGQWLDLQTVASDFRKNTPPAISRPPWVDKNVPPLEA